MPKYHIRTDDGEQTHAADQKFANDQAASNAAQEALGGMTKDALPDGASMDISAEVDNESGERVYEASIKFRGKTADDIRAEEAQDEAEAERAVEELSSALDNLWPRKPR